MRARFYPIMTHMEIIRSKITVRVAENREKSQNWNDVICPNVFKKLKLNIKSSNICQVMWNGKNGMELSEGDKRYTVNLDKLTCSCK
jgi:hypothetical protein